jgi:hypothetical protein
MEMLVLPTVGPLAFTSLPVLFTHVLAVGDLLGALGAWCNRKITIAKIRRIQKLNEM